MSVRVLGGFGVSVDRRHVEPSSWPARRAIQLVALLSLQLGRRLTVEQVIDALWPDLDPDAGRANLHKAASYARRATGDREAIVLKGGSVALWPGADVRVDAIEFESAAQSALSSGEPGGCGVVADTYGGTLLPEELYEEWTLVARERLQRVHRDLLVCAERWADVVDLDPADEVAHVALIRGHFREGRLHAAIRQFQQLRAALARELGAVPGPEATALYRELVGSSASGWIRPALVGREVELLRARAALRRALEGRPAAVIVSGAAGIGKTRLCEELVDHAINDGWFVIRASATEHASHVPYGPLVEALEALLAEQPELADHLDDRDRELLAWLAGRTSRRGDVAAHRHAVLRLLNRIVAGSRRSDAALFVDDIHLADEATIALAGIAASAPRPRGLLLVAAMRDDDSAPAAEDMANALAASGSAVRIQVGPLGRHETELIAGHVAGRVPTMSEAALVWELSAGNPFFALEVASTLATDQSVDSDGGARTAVVSRLERLAPPARQALRSVALVTDDFDTDDLAALGQLSTDDALAALGAALAAGIVGNTDTGSYRFRHDLVRQSLTEDASHAETGAAHGVMADRLSDVEGSPGRVGRHLIAAGRHDEAVPFLTRAAVEAMQVGAHADAVAFLDDALGIAPGVADLLAMRADALFAAGDPGAVAAYGVAMAVAQDPARNAIAVRRARALVLTGDIPEALAVLEHVNDIAPVDQVQHLVTRGLALWCAGAIDDADTLAEDAKTLAEQSGNLRDFVDATMLAAMVAHERGAWPQRASLDLLDSQLRPDLAIAVIDAHLCMAESFLYGGVPYPDIIAFAADLRDRAIKLGVAHAQAFATTLLGEAHLLSGDTQRAGGLLEEAVVLHRTVGVLCGEALSLQRLAEVFAADGSPVDAQGALAEALVAARGSPVATRHLLDRIHGTAIRITAGTDESVAAVDEASRAVRGPLESCPPCSINLTVPAAIACADAHQPDRARGYLAAAEQVVSAFYRQGGWHAALDEARGHLARADGDETAAHSHLVKAAQAFDRLGQRLDAQRCQAAIAVTAGKD